MLYLPKNSVQYRYAELLWNGVEMDDAQEQVEATALQCRRWRRQWRKKAAQMAGRDVSVFYALRMMFETRQEER